ncbi:hypothetical protein SAY86_027758 [Trapa natans]|uniref:Zinc finger CCCH domain-containing protein 18-like n=1 Tax=Trapa natans TaxID=22666 RepID=A0AAN7QL62_TRANT|nr:hypothetical protein SAY86_027758 [Trapa natans]
MAQALVGCSSLHNPIQMDISEATRIMYDRIQKTDPDNVSKIIGYVLLRSNGEQEMIRLACSPDTSIQSLIMEAKAELGLSHPIDMVAAVALYQCPQYSPGSNSQADHLGSHFCRNLHLPISLSPPQFPVKICHYYLKGFCKHGSKCRYFHGTPQQQFNSFSKCSPNMEDHGIPHGPLARLELEITELLKSRGGLPVSIASLPMLYFEKYGRTIQAEGYLSESQRHGKVGFSLSKLLARLKKSIRLIDRPHGQHSVILAEDADKYLGYEGIDPNGIGSASRQIYLTFPAESTFSEQDVSNYFNKFGPVQDVRIPCQQKRMFGFVSFVFANTAKLILVQGNPHFICGSRVLVKPYKEKLRISDRKYAEKMHSIARYNQCLMERDPEMLVFPDGFLGDDLLEEHQYTLELDRKRLEGLQIAPQSLPRSHLGCSSDHFYPSEVNEQPTDYSRFKNIYSLVDVGNNDSSSKDQIHWADCDSSTQFLSLPENPFAGSISTVT